MKRLEFTPVDVPDPGALHRGALLRVARQLKDRAGAGDRILSEQVRALDDLARAANLLAERQREWAALWVPEAVRAQTDPQRLARLLRLEGGRSAILAELGLGPESIGAELDKSDVVVLQRLAASLIELHGTRAAVEARLGDAVAEVAPNLAEVVGPLIAAHLVDLAGGLENLATRSAGTIQLLGAETALFRFLKEGGDPPKHGILFQHPSVHRAPPWQRGAAARALSLAAAEAARADAFTRRDVAADIRGRLDTDLARIGKKPRPKGGGKPGHGKRGGGPGGDRRGGHRGGPKGGAGPKSGRGPKGSAGSKGGGGPKGRGRHPGRKGPKGGGDR